MIKRFLSFIFILIFLAGCTPISEVSSTITADDSEATEEGVKTVIDANNQFAIDLYLNYKDEEENIFFSPYSISIALAMTYEGARGQTADEIRSVFHFPEDDSIRRSSFAKIYNQINKKDKKYKLHTANALWAQKDYKFLDEYMNTIKRYYAGKVTNLDFVNDNENSRITINKWVEEQTNNKIKDLIPQGFLDALTRLVLTNAIYFKSMWVKQFDKEDTIEEDFRISPDKTIKVPMMRLSGEEATFNYAETEELQILEMSYEGEELSMLILLPKDDDLKSVEESLSVEKLSELRNMLVEQQVDVYVPKFKFETKYFMNEILKKMGMPTAAIMEGTVFRADHPFIFAIQERGTGNILFLGRVVNPVE